MRPVTETARARPPARAQRCCAPGPHQQSSSRLAAPPLATAEPRGCKSGSARERHSFFRGCEVILAARGCSNHKRHANTTTVLARVGLRERCRDKTRGAWEGWQPGERTRGIWARFAGIRQPACRPAERNRPLAFAGWLRRGCRRRAQLQRICPSNRAAAVRRPNALAVRPRCFIVSPTFCSCCPRIPLLQRAVLCVPALSAVSYGERRARCVVC